MDTDTLIPEAAKGAESAGAVVEKFDLFRLEQYAAAFPASDAKASSIRDTASAAMG